MNSIYIERRGRENYTSYRLHSRAATIISSLEKYINKDKEFTDILDIGTADGRMLSMITEALKVRHAVGIDKVENGIVAARQAGNNRPKIFLGDAVNLPFKSDMFDILLASAVIEHIHDIDAVLGECKRVLKKGGLLCITIPNPLYDWVNSRLVNTYHVRRYTLKGMEKILMKYKFSILESGYFMLFPFGRIPFERDITRFISYLNLDFLLFNQIILGKKELNA